MVFELEQVANYLNQTLIPLRLGCMTQSGWPMIVSLWYQYQDGQILCATQKSSRVVKYLKNDPRCAFEISADLPPYCGIRSQAIAYIDEDLGASVLQQLLIRYLGGIENPLATELLKKQDTEIAIILEPKRIYTWNFTSRMTDIPTVSPTEKYCP